MSVVKVDEKGRILLSKELRKAAGVKAEDHLVVKVVAYGKMQLEKTSSQTYPRKDPLDWLLSHPARAQSNSVKMEIKKRNSTRELIEWWKEQHWVGGQGRR